MQLYKIKIENFRGYRDSEIELSKLSVIIGKNDVGKSTLLDALNIFFENEKPLENDTNVYLYKSEIIITCFFSCNTNEPIFLDSVQSEQTQTTLQSEYLLNSDNLLQIKKVFEKGKLQKTFIVANHPDKWEKPLITLKITDLKREVEKFAPESNPVNRTIKKAMREFLFQKESLNFKTQEIDVSSKESDIADIYEKLKTRLPKFMLFRADRTNTDKDSEVTDITKAIAKNAVAEVEQKFIDIKQEIRNKIQEFSSLTLEKLKTFDKEIANSLSVDLKDKALESIFSYDFKSDDDIPFNKRGSGIKRLFLLSFFIADSERQNHSNMIYAIEEPETSQHPDFQKMIIKAFQEISHNENRQILITTHTPEIVKLVNKDDIIFISKNEKNERLASQKENLNIKEVIETLGLLPYASYKSIMFVEGESDIKFFNNLNNIESLKNIFDTSKIKIIPLNGGSNLKTWIERDYFKNSNVRQLYFMDRDDKEKNNIPTQENIKLIITGKREIENYYPIDVVENYFKEKFNIDSIFSQKDKDNWDDKDIVKLIYCKSKTSNTELKELDIKSIFNCKDIWQQINENNLQNFDEIKGWFEIMRDFFED